MNILIITLNEIRILDGKSSLAVAKASGLPTKIILFHYKNKKAFKVSY
jgi:hypothetical protein